jgi:GNAT superfamily N-acetyltransferase
VNRVIERAIGTWGLAPRVQRLALPLYRYTAAELRHLTVWVAERGGETVGVAAFEPSDPADWPDGRPALLLHGLYVDPSAHRQGFGRGLLDLVTRLALQDGFDGVLVKAQAQAVGFFESCGLERLPVEDPGRDYPHRFWAALRAPQSSRARPRLSRQPTVPPPGAHRNAPLARNAAAGGEQWTS